MLTPREFEEAYPPEELAEELPNRPVSSLRDIQFLYGRLYTLATAGGGKYASYLTPNQADDLLDSEESLIVVMADLSGEHPTLAGDPIKVTKYRTELIEKVAHSKYSAAAGIDHSVTHLSGQNSGLEKLTRYAKERLTKWATDEVVQSVATDHEDGWILNLLAALGEDQDELDKIEEAMNSLIGGPTTALLTVRVKLEPGSKFLWPGELDIFNEAMRARKLSKLVSKGEATDSSGMAVDLLSGARTRTVGTADDPLNYFLGKQMEKFPGLDPDEAWRSHPVSEDNAVTIMNAKTFVDGCTYPSFGATVYYLPYFLGKITPSETYLIYTILYRTVESGDLTSVENAYQHLGDGGVEQHGPRLRFYVAAVMKQQMSRYDVFGDTLDGSLIFPVEVAASHEEVLRGWAFDVNGERSGPTRPPLPTHEEWSLISSHLAFGAIASGAYIFATFSHGDDDQAASADDARIKALVSILAGEPISIEILLSEYVDRLVEDSNDSFPRYLVSSQFAQLCALATAGLVTAHDAESYGAIAEAPGYDDTQTMVQNESPARADGGTIAAARDEKLEQFIEQTPAFENPERRGVFLLGVLIGQVGGYQHGAEGRSTTVVDQYPIKSMTKTRLKRVTEEVLDRNIVYSRENAMRSTMYAEVVDRLVDTLTVRDPDTWEIATDDLRFYYALGVGYGLNNWTESNDNSTEAEQTEV